MSDYLLEGICVRAAAWIVKYCEKDDDGCPLLIDVHFLHTCVHPGNRGGVYTQGEACRTLLKSIGTDGFLIDQANTTPIVMRERPEQKRTTDYETFLQYNIRKTSHDSLLAGAYQPTDHVSYANLAHCHLENVVRAVHRKLPWGHSMFPPQLGIRSCDSDGKLSIATLAAHPNFKELKEWMKVGFRSCKVVSARMDDEEPTAASAISAAQNKGQSVAMREHEWTALSTLNGLCIPSNGEYSE